MKKILLLVAAFVAFAHISFAGQLSAIAGTAFGGGNSTTNVANAATNTCLTTFANPNSSQLNIAVWFQCSVSNSTAVTFRLDCSNDNVNWTTNALNWSITSSATPGAVTGGNTNLNGTMPMWRIRTIENPGAGDITNLLVTAYSKVGI